MTPAGLYNTTVSIEDVVLSQGTSGELTEAWSETASVAGRIRLLSGDEGLRGERDAVVSTHRVYIAPTTITTKSRVVVNGKTYNVTYVNPMSKTDSHMEVDVRIVE